MMAGTLVAWLGGAEVARAHCDTMDGPVVADAKSALETGDIAVALKWIPKEDEAELRVAFSKTVAVRGLSPDAKELADAYFFETLVRLHRASEGESYTGLKPAGTALEPGVAESDEALRTGNVDKLIDAATRTVGAGIKQRFGAAVEARNRAAESIDSGREYVAAYVAFVHFVEGIFASARGEDHDHAEQAKPNLQPQHEHHHSANPPTDTSRPGQ